MAKRLKKMPDEEPKKKEKILASNKSNNNDNMAKNGFKLNPKHKGWCTPMTKSTCTGKRRQFAINAKNHFKKKAFDGTELDPIDFSNHPKWLDTYQDPYPSFPGFQDDNTLAPVTVTNRNNRKLDTSLAPIEHDYGMVNKSLDKGPGIELATNTPSTTQPKQRGGYDGNIGNKLLTGLSLIDALIPGKKQKYNYLTPDEQVWNNQNPYGTGSSALMKAGGELSASKAQEMLDNPPRGKKLTAKQKKYFQAVAHGWKPKAPDGITVPADKTVTYHPELYTPFGDGAQRAFDEGWMPETDAINGVTTYKNRYNTSFNSVHIPGQDSKGSVALMGSKNGLFDVVLRDGNKNIKQKILQGANMNQVDNYFKNYNSTTAHRVKSIEDGTNGDADPYGQLASRRKVGGILKNGGKMYKSGGLMVEGGKASQVSPSFTQFQGPSHANGGIDIAYGGTPVEVEGQEMFSISNDGTGVVWGNMTVPGTSMKFKTAGKKLADKENKALKQENTGVALMEDNNIMDKFERLSYNSGMLKSRGAADKLSQIDTQKNFLSNLQQNMLNFAEQHNLDPEAMSNGKKKKAKNGAFITAENGKSTRADRNNNPGNIKYGSFAKKLGATGQDADGFAIFPSREQGSKAMKTLLTGASYKDLTVRDAIHRWTANDPYDLSGLGGIKGTKVADLSSQQLDQVLNYMARGEGTKYGGVSGKTNLTPTEPVERPRPAFTPPTVERLPSFTPPGFDTPTPTNPTTSQTPPERNWDFSVPAANPPSNVTPLRFEQFAPELFSIATNRPEFVPAQMYTPQLFQPYQVSFQDRINENNQLFNAVESTLSDNPAALSSLAAQTYGANNAVRAEEFRTNQAINNEIINKNVALQNQAQLQNLGTLDQQYVRQAQARSNTRRDTQATLNSLSSKILQHDYENATLAAYENMSNYRMVDTNNDGIPDRATYFGPEYTPPTDYVAGTTYSDANTDDIRYRNYPESKVRYDAYGVPVSSSTEDNYRPVTRPYGRKKKNGGNIQKKFNEQFGRR